MSSERVFNDNLFDRPSVEVIDHHHHHGLHNDTVESMGSLAIPQSVRSEPANAMRLHAQDQDDGVEVESVASEREGSVVVNDEEHHAVNMRIIKESVDEFVAQKDEMVLLMTSDEDEDDGHDTIQVIDSDPGDVVDGNGAEEDGNHQMEESKEKQPKQPKQAPMSMLKVDADDEIISDIESVDDSEEHELNGKMKILGVDDNHSDLPPPAPKNIRFLTRNGMKPGHRKTASAALPSRLDPNKKARIERYVMDSKEQGIHAQVMIRVLCVYARLNKGVEYVQGMNELLAPIYYIFCMDPSENRKYAEVFEAKSCFCCVGNRILENRILFDDLNLISICFHEGASPLTESPCHFLLSPSPSPSPFRRTPFSVS